MYCVVTSRIAVLSVVDHQFIGGAGRSPERTRNESHKAPLLVPPRRTGERNVRAADRERRAHQCESALLRPELVRRPVPIRD